MYRVAGKEIDGKKARKRVVYSRYWEASAQSAVARLSANSDLWHVHGIGSCADDIAYAASVLSTRLQEEQVEIALTLADIPGARVPSEAALRELALQPQIATVNQKNFDVAFITPARAQRALASTRVLVLGAPAGDSAVSDECLDLLQCSAGAGLAGWGAICRQHAWPCQLPKCTAWSTALKCAELLGLPRATTTPSLSAPSSATAKSGITTAATNAAPPYLFGLEAVRAWDQMLAVLARPRSVARASETAITGFMPLWYHSCVQPKKRIEGLPIGPTLVLERTLCEDTRTFDPALEAPDSHLPCRVSHVATQAWHAVWLTESCVKSLLATTDYHEAQIDSCAFLLHTETNAKRSKRKKKEVDLKESIVHCICAPFVSTGTRPCLCCVGCPFLDWTTRENHAADLSSFVPLGTATAKSHAAPSSSIAAAAKSNKTESAAAKSKESKRRASAQMLPRVGAMLWIPVVVPSDASVGSVVDDDDEKSTAAPPSRAFVRICLSRGRCTIPQRRREKASRPCIALSPDLDARAPLTATLLGVSRFILNPPRTRLRCIPSRSVFHVWCLSLLHPSLWWNVIGCYACEHDATTLEGARLADTRVWEQWEDEQRLAKKRVELDLPSPELETTSSASETATASGEAAAVAAAAPEFKNQLYTTRVLGFHGTSLKALAGILQRGFDPHLTCSSDWGHGTYFARHPDYPTLEPNLTTEMTVNGRKHETYFMDDRDPCAPAALCVARCQIGRPKKGAAERVDLPADCHTWIDEADWQNASQFAIDAPDRMHLVAVILFASRQFISHGQHLEPEDPSAATALGAKHMCRIEFANQAAQPLTFKLPPDADASDMSKSS